MPDYLKGKLVTRWYEDGGVRSGFIVDDGRRGKNGLFITWGNIEAIMVHKEKK